MPDIRTCLWFTDRAEEAVDLYTRLVPDSRIESMQRPSADSAPILIHFTLAGTPFSILNAGGGPAHSTAASIAVTLPQQEADQLYDALIDAGGNEVECGWVTDPFSISWQIIPEGFTNLLFGEDPAANARAFDAMHQMKRLDCAPLRAARAAP